MDELSRTLGRSPEQIMADLQRFAELMGRIKAEKEKPRVASQDKVKKEKVDVVKVVNHGDEMILPDGMSIDRAITTLQREKAYRDEVMSIRAPIDGLMPDVAHAFFQSLKETFGWAHNVPTPGFWKDEPPALIQVAVGLGEVINVPWGRIVVPGMQGYLETSMEQLPTGQFRVVIGGAVKRKDEGKVKQIIERTKKYLRERSIYKGKAFRIRLKNDCGQWLEMPEPNFLDINRNLKNELIFSRDVMAAIATSVFTPIKHTDLVRRLRVPLKRGILLSGKFGTGKSMTSTVVADLCTENGWTFILCESPLELADVLRMAREYGPCVVFCEDVDRVLEGDRDMAIDNLLNVIDGVEAKAAELMVVLTTNNVDQITRAMLRPGRLDAVIEVKPPDAEAAERLMRLYARGLIAPDADISKAGKEVAGEIPAVIQEVVERAKLAAILRDPEAAFEEGAIVGDDLYDAALSMRNQIELLNGKEPDGRSQQEIAAQIRADAVRDAARIIRGELSGDEEPTPKKSSNGIHPVVEADLVEA